MLPSFRVGGCQRNLGEGILVSEVIPAHKNHQWGFSEYQDKFDTPLSSGVNL